MNESAERDNALLSEALGDMARRETSDGEAPDTAELQAYLAGELAEERSERVRAWLVAHEEAGERALELLPFVEARPPANDAAIDLQERASWKDLRERLKTGDESHASADAPITSTEVSLGPAVGSAPAVRWWRAVAAVLTLTSGLLLLRVLHLESLPEAKNFRKLELAVGDRGTGVKPISLKTGEQALVQISPGPIPDGCEVFQMEIIDLQRNTSRTEDLRLTDHYFSFLLYRQPGARRLTLTACKKNLGEWRVDLALEP